MKFSRHAVKQMHLRGITQADADAVPTNHTKTAPGDNGATNFWGYDSGGFRIRVTVAANGTVITVAWADSRK